MKNSFELSLSLLLPWRLFHSCWNVSVISLVREVAGVAVWRAKSTVTNHDVITARHSHMGAEHNITPQQLPVTNVKTRTMVTHLPTSNGAELETRSR